MSIFLNFAGEPHDPLAEWIVTLTSLVSEAVTVETDRSRELLAETRPLMKEIVSWIYTCPPFCCQEEQNEWYYFDLAMNQQKEQNKQHPVYALFSTRTNTTRTNTIRKHHQRKKISDELRQASLPLSIPSTRYEQLRRVAYLCVTAEDDAEKAYKKAIKKIQDNLDAGEYGKWVEIQRMPQLSQRNGPVEEAKYRTDQTAAVE